MISSNALKTHECTDQCALRHRFSRIIMNRRRSSGSLTHSLLQNDQLSPSTDDEEKPPSSVLPRALQVIATLFRQRSQSHEVLSAKDINFIERKVMFLKFLFSSA